MSATLNRHQRLAAIGEARGLSFGGFRRDLKKLVEEFNPRDSWEDDHERPFTEREYQESLSSEFYEWFGTCQVVPTAHRIRRDGRDGDDIFSVTVEVYEVEASVEISDWKLDTYSNMADTDGPHIELHILDRYDHEIIVPSLDLMCFWPLHLGSDKSRPRAREYEAAKHEFKKSMRARAAKQHHVTIDRNETDRLRRALRKTQYATIKDALQDIVYGLGSSMTHRDIAEQCGIDVAIVTATNRLLASKNIAPRRLVKDKQAQWKVAYDALRELGITT